MQRITRQASASLIVVVIVTLLGASAVYTQAQNIAPIPVANVLTPPDREPNIFFLRPGQPTREIMLDSSASRDPDGSIVSHVWSGTPDPADLIRPTVTLAAGAYTFTLRVTDNAIPPASTEATVSITVILLQRPVADARENPPVFLEAGQSAVEITLDGSASSDADGTIAEYRWTGTPDPADVATPTVTLGPGRHTFTLVVVDNDGLTAQATVTVSVFAVTLVTPQDGQVIAGNAVALVAAVVLDNAVSARFELRLTGTSEFTNIGGITTVQPFLVPWNTTTLPDGTYELRAMVNRSAGGALLSPNISVTVNNANPNRDTTDILENDGSKIQALLAGEDNTVITSDGVVVEIPAGVLPADDDLLLKVEDPAALLVDISLDSGVDTFPEPITIRIPYMDRNDDGIVDDTGTNEAALTMWSFDDSEEAWVRVPGATVDPVANVVQGTTDHLTIFGVFLAPLSVMAGDQSPTAALTVDGVVEDLTVLQVELATGAEDVRLNTVTMTFAAASGDATAITRLQANLVQDTNGNGQADAGEQVLASQSTTSVADTLSLPLTSPLEMPRNSTTLLLVTLDINTSSGSSRAASSLPAARSTLPPTSLAGLLLPLALGLLWFPQRAARGFTGLFLLVLCCSLAVLSCSSGGNGDEDDRSPFTFTVGLPANGVSGQGTLSDQLSGPAVALPGPTVTVMP